MKKYCKVAFCGRILHPVRIKLGYNKCVECSNTQKVSYIPIIANKQVQES